MKKATLIILLTGLTIASIAQEKVFPGDTTVQLHNSNFDKTIYVDVLPEHKFLMHRLKSEISSGYMSVEIYDARNKRSGGFTLKGKNGAKGTAEDIFDKPKEGKWRVRIIARDASGYVRIEVRVDD